MHVVGHGEELLFLLNFMITKHLLFLILPFVTVLGGGCTAKQESAASPQVEGNRPPWANSSDCVVVTHYFNWFKTPDVSGKWKLWDWTGKGQHHNPDVIFPNGRRDIASVYYPLIGPYDSSRPEVMEYHMLTALAAKIDGFFIDWYGIPSEEEKGFPALLDLAERVGFKMCICFEDKAMFGYSYHARTRDEAVQNAIKNLNYILETHAQRKGYLRIDGKPVIINFSWTEPSSSVEAQGFSAAEYGIILREVRKKHDFYFVHDLHGHIRENYWPVSDNLYPWLDVNGETLDRFYNEAKSRLQKGDIRFLTTLVYPGFDNTGVWGWGDGPYVTPRENGALYERSWRKAIEHKCRFTQIATWNDFCEGATIEPSREYGYEYLEMTERFAAELKAMPSDHGRHLRLPLRLYELRLAIRGQAVNPGIVAELNGQLDQAAVEFSRGHFRQVEEILERVGRASNQSVTEAKGDVNLPKGN